MAVVLRAHREKPRVPAYTGGDRQSHPSIRQGAPPLPGRHAARTMMTR
ncbi:MAG: hypothetical protein ACMG6H_12080 [Acidobacteriota bacterium]